MNIQRLSKNYIIVDNAVISYETKVARINHTTKEVYELGYWSNTTRKHVRKAANRLNYDLVRYTQAMGRTTNKEKGRKMKTHLVLDFFYYPDERQDCFAGTLEECMEFAATQTYEFMYKVVPMTKDELKYHNQERGK